MYRGHSDGDTRFIEGTLMGTQDVKGVTLMGTPDVRGDPDEDTSCKVFFFLHEI